MECLGWGRDVGQSWRQGRVPDPSITGKPRGPVGSRGTGWGSVRVKGIGVNPRGTGAGSDEGGAQRERRWGASGPDLATVGKGGAGRVRRGRCHSSAWREAPLAKTGTLEEDMWSPRHRLPFVRRGLPGGPLKVPARWLSP